MIAILKHGRPLALLLSLLHLAGCTATIWQPRIIETSDFVNSDGIVGFVKCHMKAGDIYVFKAWHLSDDHQTLTGKGLHYGVDRKRSTPGEFTVELAEIALIETTHPGEFVSGPAAVMGVM
ncbi:MAG: hypothetical protein FJY67_11755, partial [Calditrichaeota bacterium]|nr:hypothetical protein [Calditrichota bacterium]